MFKCKNNKAKNKRTLQPVFEENQGPVWECAGSTSALGHLVTEEICQLEKMGHKDCTPQQIPDRKGVQSLKGNYPGK